MCVILSSSLNLERKSKRVLFFIICPPAGNFFARKIPKAGTSNTSSTSTDTAAVAAVKDVITRANQGGASWEEVLNPSLETAGANGQPVDWNTRQTGTNTSVFTYTGHFQNKGDLTWSSDNPGTNVNGTLGTPGEKFHLEGIRASILNTQSR